MLTLCIPAFDEAPTVGLLLWRLRRHFEEHPREYEVLVLDDGSTDGTADVLRPYARVMPLTVLARAAHLGYAAALDALLRAAAERTRYPRRDALVLMQGDLTEGPEDLPELLRPFDGGADLVVAERALPAAAPAPVRRLRRLAGWLARPIARLTGVEDPAGSMRLVRLSVVREAIKRANAAPLCRAEGWAANAELLARLAPCARRVERVTVVPRYALRPRATRVRTLAGAVAILRFARAWRAAAAR